MPEGCSGLSTKLAVVLCGYHQDASLRVWAYSNSSDADVGAVLGGALPDN
jgi:hypothetical protein